jgi:hypothetical protein
MLQYNAQQKFDLKIVIEMDDRGSTNYIEINRGIDVLILILQ